MLLIFHGTRSYRIVGEDIRKVAVILRIQHFVRTGEAGLLYCAGVQPAYGDYAVQHILGTVGVRLVEHTFVALSCGTGLSGIDAGDNEDLVFYLFLNCGKAGDVVHYRVLSVGGAGTYYQNESLVLSSEYCFHFLVTLCLCLCDAFRERVKLLYKLRDRELSVECHAHLFSSCCVDEIWFVI